METKEGLRPGLRRKRVRQPLPVMFFATMNSPAAQAAWGQKSELAAPRLFTKDFFHVHAATRRSFTALHVASRG